MKSVKSIGKITKAMKMVAASKMKGDIKRLMGGRDYGLNAIDMIFKSDQHMQPHGGQTTLKPCCFSERYPFTVEPEVRLLHITNAGGY